jgi:predicted extracellular nuclease
MKKAILAAVAMLVAAMTNSSQGAMRITEWAYQGNGGEYIEFTNTGASPIDMTGWSFDDDSQSAGVVNLSAFGVVSPGESVILTEAVASSFRTAWGLAPSVKVIGSNTTNLGRADQINIFNGPTLVDTLTYGDQTFPGTIRTQNVSGNPITLAALGTNNVAQWQLSFVGDAYGSHLSTLGDLGNPGIGNYVVPEPSTVALLILGSVALCTSGAKRLARRRSN